jgi:hypothetical protein
MQRARPRVVRRGPLGLAPSLDAVVRVVSACSGTRPTGRECFARARELPPDRGAGARGGRGELAIRIAYYWVDASDARTGDGEVTPKGPGTVTVETPANSVLLVATYYKRRDPGSFETRANCLEFAVGHVKSRGRGTGPSSGSA